MSTHIKEFLLRKMGEINKNVNDLTGAIRSHFTTETDAACTCQISRTAKAENCYNADHFTPSISASMPCDITDGMFIEVKKLKKRVNEIDDAITSHYAEFSPHNGKYESARSSSSLPSDSTTAKTFAVSLEKGPSYIINTNREGESQGSMIKSSSKLHSLFKEDDGNSAFPFGSYDKKRTSLNAERKAEYSSFLEEKDRQEKKKETEKYTRSLSYLEPERRDQNKAPKMLKWDEKLRDTSQFVPFTEGSQRKLESLGTRSSTTLRSIPPVSSKNLSEKSPLGASTIKNCPFFRDSVVASPTHDPPFFQDAVAASPPSRISKPLDDAIKEKEIYLEGLENLIKARQQKLEVKEVTPEPRSDRPSRMNVQSVPPKDYGRRSPLSFHSDYEVRRKQEKLRQLQYNQDLKVQIEEKRQLQQLEKEKRLLEDLVEERKRAEEQRKINAQYEAEQNERIRKQQEAELKRRRLIQLQNERFAEEQQRQLAEEEQRRKLSEKRETSASSFNVASDTSHSPPVPAIRTQAVMQNQQQPKKKLSGDELCEQLAKIRREIRAMQRAKDASEGEKSAYIISDRRAVQEDSDDDNDYHIIGSNHK